MSFKFHSINPKQNTFDLSDEKVVPFQLNVNTPDIAPQVESTPSFFLYQVWLGAGRRWEEMS